MVNMMMKALLAHQTLGVGNRINVNRRRLWNKIIKLCVDNNEGIACTLNPQYRNMKTMFKMVRVLHTMMKVGRLR
jgi:hypothetical protein